jgi:GNAT superfamily N-acetyltransferase
MVSTGTVSVVRVSEDHAELLAAFYRRVWDASATPESVLHARRNAALHNAAEPGQDVPTFLFLSGSQAIGHVTTIPIRLWSAGAERAAYWLKGLMVLPEHRNGPVGFLLLRDAIRQLDCTLAFVVQAAARRLFEGVGFSDLGGIPNHIRLLRPASVLRRLDPAAVGLGSLPPWLRLPLQVVRQPPLAQLAGHTLSGALRAWSAASSLGANRSQAALEDGIEADEVGSLWNQVRRGIAAAPARNAAHVRSLGGGRRDSVYRWVLVRQGAGLVGYGAVRRPNRSGDARLGGIRVATLSDLFFPLDRPDLGLAVLAGAEAAAREFEADALLCSASHRTITPLLRRRGYVSVSPNVHLLTRDPAGAAELPPALQDWWVLRGDSEADGVF